MSYDLLIINGVVIDGSGMPRYVADVGIRDGRIVDIGRRKSRVQAKRIIDAGGHVVAPGFIDVHTHMDAQFFWEPLGAQSCWHGITTVVMGNCGLTMAPCRPEQRALVVENFAGVEDIPREAMTAGIDWCWETFPEYFDVLDKRPKGINYSAYVGHSTLRTYAMGERAFTTAAPTEQETAVMSAALSDALRAGALGFSTSRSQTHKTQDGAPVSSRNAAWSEVAGLVGTLAMVGGRIFEIAGEESGFVSGVSDESIDDYLARLKALAIETGVTVTWGTMSGGGRGAWRKYLNLLDTTAAGGGRMTAQVHSRPMTAIWSFETHLPFDDLSAWKKLRGASLPEQLKMLADSSCRKSLADDIERAGAAIPGFDNMFVMRSGDVSNPTVANLAKAKGQSALDVFFDIACQSGLKQLFYSVFLNRDTEEVFEMMAHPRSIVTFSDSGAHIAQISDSSLQTSVFSYWVRERQKLTLEQAVHMLTLRPALAWGFWDRGLVRPGMAADLVIFDPDKIAPQLPYVAADLPGGAKRLKQGADGILATIVNGDILIERGAHTGAYPGRLLRGSLHRAS